MANEMKNAEKNALGRIGAAVKKTGSPDVKSSLVEVSMEYARAVRARGDPSKGLPADKKFIDSLYDGEGGDFSLTDIERA